MGQRRRPSGRLRPGSLASEDEMHEHQRTSGRRRPTIGAARPRQDDPITELQQTVGNQAVQRLIDGSAGSPPKDAAVMKAAAQSPFAPASPTSPTKAGAKQAAAHADHHPTKAAAAESETDDPPSPQPPGSGPPIGATPLISSRFAGDPDLQACRQGQRLFQWGSNGPSVVTLQQALVDLGYAMPEYGADGAFGGETHGAVLQYQRDAGLGADGIIGTNTVGALDLDVATVEPPGTEPPGTEPPGTEPPGTEPPGTEPPGTEPPGTAPPGTEPPGTEPPGSFDHADIQAIWDAHAPGTARQRQAFETLDVDVSGPWQNVDWSTVRRDAAMRVFNPSSIHQRTLAVCGPATIAQMQADVTPDRYAAFVRQVFETATIDGDTANDDLLANVPTTGMAQADWMLLSCMRDTENAIFDFEGNASEQFEGITMPGEMSEWMEEILGCVETEHYTSYLWGEISNAETVSALMNAHGDGVVVAMLVDADALQNDSGAINIPDHWVRLLEPIDTSGERIRVRVYTWGNEYEFEYDEDGFEDVLFEFVVGALQPGISL